jgi:hypothetical protein
LLDENISQTLHINFDKHQVKTIDEMGWSGKKNGELLRLMVKYEFDVLLTTDRNIKYRQNIKRFPITIFILAAGNNRDETIQPLIKIARKKLNGQLNKGIFEIRK